MAVLRLRRHLISRLLVCLLLSWTGADLLMPELCTAEAATAGSSSPLDSQDRDDCFCCCMHTQVTALVVVRVGVVEAAPFAPLAEDALTPGVPRSLYHPPLSS